MIAADTSSLVAFLDGSSGQDVELVAAASASGQLALPPVVITEILSDAMSSEALGAILPDVALLEPGEGYWARAGMSRQLLRRHGLKAKVGDALIAQSCLDHDVALITRDSDFRHFAKHCGLKLA